jgi:hypothetical protein
MTTLEDWQRAVIRAAFPGDEALAQSVFEFLEGVPFCSHPHRSGPIGSPWMQCGVCGAQVRA